MRSEVARYALAVLCVAAALALSLLLRHILHAETILLAGVMAAAWFGGSAAGLLATVLAVLTYEIAFLAPAPNAPRLASIAGVARFIAFLLAAFLISAVGAARKRAEAALRAARDDLDAKVRERTASLAQANEQLGAEIADRKRGELRLGTQYAVTRILAESSTLADAAPRLPQAIGEGLGWEWGALWYVDREACVLRCSATWHAPDIDTAQFEATSRELTFRPGRGLPGQAWEAMAPAWVADLRTHPDFVRARSADEVGLRGAVAFPILLGGETLGVIELFSRTVREPDQEQLDTLSAIGSQVGQFIDRKRTEETLLRSEAYLAEAQKLSHTGSWAWSVATGEFVHWSEEHFRLHGLDPRAGIPSWEAASRQIHPEDRDRCLESIDRAIRERTDCELDYRAILPDGTIRYIHSVSHPLFNESGELVEFVGTEMDVTERKQAEEERQAHVWFLESMNRVNRAIQGTSDLEQMTSDVLATVLSIFDCDGVWLLYPCDPDVASFRVVMEHSRPEFPGAFALGIREFPMEQETARFFQAVRASNGPVRFDSTSEHLMLTPRAKRFGLQSGLGMALYPKVDSPYMFGLHQSSYARNWTPQEERLFQEIGRRLGDALTTLVIFRNLRDSEAKLEQAQRIAHVGYWDRDLDTDRFTWSDETYHIFGLRPQERTITFAGLLELIHPEDRQIVTRATAEALRGGRRYDVEYRVVRPRGEVRVVHSQGDLTTDESGRPRRLFGTVQDITERKRAEEELRRREIYLAESQRQSRTGTWGWDSVSGNDFWSDEVFRIFGYDPDETRPSYRAVMERIDPEDKPAVEQTLGRSASERKDSELEYRIVLPDGSVRHIHSLGHPVLNASGDLTEYLVTVSDVTDRKRAEIEFRESEKRYRRIFETAGVSIWEEDFSRLKVAVDDLKARGVQDFRAYLAEHPEFVQQAISMARIVDVNEATVRLFGAESKDELLESLHKVFTPETERVFAGELLALAEGRTLFEGETVLRTLRGEELNVLFTITFPPEADRFDSVLVTVTDITERKRAEERLRQQASLLEQTHDAIIVWEFPGTIIYWNRGAQQLYGFSEEEAIGRFIHDLLRTEHPMPIGLFGPMLERRGAWSGELTHTTRDGRKVIVDSRQVLVDLADGRRLVLETNRDITEHKRDSEALREAQAELARVTRVTMLGEITASIAHEVNQPLAAVVMNGNACRRWLAANPPNLDEVREAVQRIVNDGNRASEVIRRIRSLLQRQVPEKTTLGINDIIRDTLALTRSELARHHVSVRTELREDLPSVLGDRVGLEQVLVNLILNAVDAMAGVSESSRVLTIRSRADDAEGVVVEVQDSGRGLDPEHASRIFEAFFSTKPGGLGMGLAISRSIVEAHGGRLWAAPHGGPGLTMRFTLPLEAGGGA